MLGNGVVGILAETCNMWERRAPLCPSHCARLLHCGGGKSGVNRIILQPSTARIHHDAQYEDVGCEISDDLSECGLIVGIKQPKLETILPNRAYAFFSHTHKAQPENMPLLDKILFERVSLYDYELIVGDNGERLLAFGKYAGRAGLIDFLSGLGIRYLNLGYSTPFLSLGASYMYSSLAAAKAAVIAVGEEIATLGLPIGISPVVFVFTGSGNVSQGAQEIFKLLPHTFVDPSQLPELFEMDHAQQSRASRRAFQVYGCVVTCQDMVAPKDPTKKFDKVDYYAHPEHYNPVFHERIAPFASVIVNCVYWEKRFPRLLKTKQLQELKEKGCPLVGISDITCDLGGSIEFINQTTSFERPFFRYNPLTDSYHNNMEGDGVICLSIDILPTEFAREASQHFGDILSQFLGILASTIDITELPPHLRRACVVQQGSLTSLFEYILRMRNTDTLVAKWALKLQEYGLQYEPRSSEKGHVLAGIIADFTIKPSGEQAAKVEQKSHPTWKVYVDGSYENCRAGVGVYLITPTGEKIHRVIRLMYPLINNEAEYEAVIAGIQLAKEQGATQLEIEVVERSQPVHACVKEVLQIEGEDWRIKIRDFLNGVENLNAKETAKLSRIAPMMCLIQGIMYKKLPSGILLRCVLEEDGREIMTDLHKGECGNHSGRRGLVHRTLSQEYFWPNMKVDVEWVVKRCRERQLFALLIHAPVHELRFVKATWPFAKWGMDIVGPFPQAAGGFKFIVAATYYFTKWEEATALRDITGVSIKGFIWKNIICRYGIPHTLINDNGIPFKNALVQDMCQKYNIKIVYNTPYYPMGNGQQEATNKTLLANLKKKKHETKRG